MGISISSLQQSLAKNDTVTANFLGTAFSVLFAAQVYKDWWINDKKTKDRLDDLVALGLSFDLAKHLTSSMPESCGKWRSAVWLLPLIATFRREIFGGLQLIC